MPDFLAPQKTLPEQPRGQAWVLGLTGGIGSGKSTAARCFEALGAVVIDADAIARELTAAGGAAMPAVAALFGSAALDAAGAMRRDVVRARVFAQPALKAQLEAILHPLIQSTITARSQAAMAAGAQLLVLDIPLLAEGWARWAHMVDVVAVVHAPAPVRTARVQRRSGLTQEQIAAIMAAQASDEARLKIAHWVLDNGAELSKEDYQNGQKNTHSLQEQVFSVVQQLKEKMAN